jgi:hypothetical protein
MICALLIFQTPELPTSLGRLDALRDQGELARGANGRWQLTGPAPAAPAPG